MLEWTDDHCHLPGTVAEAAPVIAAAMAAGVTRMISVGCDVAQSRDYQLVAAANPGVVWASAGVHPHEASGGIDGLEELLSQPQVVAVGECGFDFHYNHSPADAQREVFAAQIRLAIDHDLALIIHTREAWDDTFAVLAEVGVPERTVFHCFSGGPEEARRCLDVGAYLSFSGIVTFPSAADLRDAVAVCPADRLLVETDAPYLAPVPHRGKRNEPAWVAVVGEAVARVREETPADVAFVTTRNAAAVYRLG